MMAALAAATVPAMAQQVKYAVSGTGANDGKKIYLTDLLTDKTIDSMVVANGKFSFSGTADKDAFMSVRAEGKKWTTEFFNDGTPVSINLSDSTLKGSPLNERLTKLLVEQDLPRRAMNAKVSKMTEEEITAHQDEIMDEMNKMIDSMTAFADKDIIYLLVKSNLRGEEEQ